MNHDPASTISGALSTARACWELANDAVEYGRISAVIASTVSRAAFEAAAEIQLILETAGHSLSPECSTLLTRCVIDLEAIAALASLALTSTGSANSAFHLAHSLRFSTEMAVNNLTRAERTSP